MKEPTVVDTNVPIVANEQAPQATAECVQRCARELLRLQRDGVILVDDHNVIFRQYRGYLSPSGRPGLGDAFFRWLWDNQGDPAICRKVAVSLHDDREYEEFPDDAGLVGFDRADRVFVAVALASGEMPPILNASDTDWWIFREPLIKHGLHVDFLCPELMRERA